jgi:hypothetical protein
VESIASSETATATVAWPGASPGSASGEGDVSCLRLSKGDTPSPAREGTASTRHRSPVASSTVNGRLPPALTAAASSLGNLTMPPTPISRTIVPSAARKATYALSVRPNSSTRSDVGTGPARCRN